MFETVEDRVNVFSAVLFSFAIGGTMLSARGLYALQTGFDLFHRETERSTSTAFIEFVGGIFLAACVCISACTFAFDCDEDSDDEDSDTESQASDDESRSEGGSSSSESSDDDSSDDDSDDDQTPHGKNPDIENGDIFIMQVGMKR